MAEIVLRARAVPTGLTPAQRRLTGKERGKILAVGPDGQDWGRKVIWPSYAILKIPGIAVSRIKKYTEPQLTEDVTDPDWTPTNRVKTPYRMRRWRLRWANLPQGIKDTLVANNGVLIIKAGSYSGPSDYNWAQIRSYFRNQETDTDENGNL